MMAKCEICSNIARWEVKDKYGDSVLRCSIHIYPHKFDIITKVKRRYKATISNTLFFTTNPFNQKIDKDVTVPTDFDLINKFIQNKKIYETITNK